MDAFEGIAAGTLNPAADDQRGRPHAKVTVETLQVWKAQTGRELIRVAEDGTANVIVNSCTEDELRALALACLEAADYVHHRTVPNRKL